jgi:hypothetical protein
VRRILSALSSIAVLLAALFSVAIFFTNTSQADSGYCLGPNLCSVWHTPHTTELSEILQQCAQLSCKTTVGSPDPSHCNVKTCKIIPSTCGTGSHWNQTDPTCSADNLDASSEYHCESSHVDVLFGFFSRFRSKS